MFFGSAAEFQKHYDIGLSSSQLGRVLALQAHQHRYRFAATLLDCERAGANLRAIRDIVYAWALLRSAGDQQRVLAALLHESVEFGFHVGLTVTNAYLPSCDPCLT